MAIYLKSVFCQRGKNIVLPALNNAGSDEYGIFLHELPHISGERDYNIGYNVCKNNVVFSSENFSHADVFEYVSGIDSEMSLVNTVELCVG